MNKYIISLLFVIATVSCISNTKKPFIISFDSNKDIIIGLDSINVYYESASLAVWSRVINRSNYDLVISNNLLDDTCKSKASLFFKTPNGQIWPLCTSGGDSCFLFKKKTETSFMLYLTWDGKEELTKGIFFNIKDSVRKYFPDGAL